MKQERSKICPACETRNKAKWEFCVRCGESLQNVALADEGTAAPVTAEEAPAETGSPLGTLVALGFALAGLVAVVALVQRTAPPEPPAPTAFQIATVPPSVAAQPSAVPSSNPSYDNARRLAAQGDLAGALTAFRELVAAEPANAEHQSQYAQLLLQAGQREEALRHFEDAARLSPQASYKLGYAAALNQVGRIPEASEQYQEVLRSEPRSEQALKELGSLMNRTGKWEEAAQYLTQAAELSPNDLVLQQALAWANEGKGDLDQAAESYRTILGAMPEAAVSRARLAEVLLRQKKTPEALALIEQGLERDPNVPLLKRARASLLERSGRIAEAITEYRDYARIAPNADDARVILDRAAQLEKRAAGGSS